MDVKLEVLQKPHPLLRQVAEPVEVFDEVLQRTVADMIDTLRETPVRGGRGVGLAGPQVGFMRRAIVVCLPYDTPREFINPVIVSASKERTGESEQCLSVDRARLSRYVERSRKVVVEYQNIRGVKLTTKATGLFARVLQHEIDHLDGKLIA